MPPTPRRAQTSCATPPHHPRCAGLCRAALQSKTPTQEGPKTLMQEGPKTPTKEGRDRFLPLLFVLICCVAALTTRAVRAQDQPGPTPPPPPQQTDRPPWARKNKSNSNNSNGSNNNTTDSSKNSSSTASTNPPPIVQPIPADDPPADQQQRGRIRVNVQLVSVLTSVLDEHNRPAIDIPRESFHVFEEGVEQKIEVFESETQQPLDLALMIDASLSAYPPNSASQRSPRRLQRR
jgi:hypothetical protein